MRRENESLETYKNLSESRAALARKEQEAVNEQIAAREKFKDDYHIRMDMRNRKDATRSNLMEAARNAALSTVIKAIYIGALEAHTLTDEGIMLAESMVDTWIAENGGASAILNKVGNKTYLLSRITQIVEDAAAADVAEIEAEDKDEVVSTDTKKDMAVAATKEFLKDADKKDVQDFMTQVFSASKEEEKTEESEAPVEDAEKPEEEVELELPDAVDKPEDGDEGEEGKEAPEDKPEEETSEKPEESEAPVEDAGAEEEEKDPLATTFEDDPEDDGEDDEEDDENDSDDEDDEPSKEDIEDDTEEELGEPLDDDGIDHDTTIDGHTDNEGKIFDELSKEEDVQKAVEIIRSRIADAEETFIRNNAEDKKKIDELLNKISTNVKTTEDLGDKDETKAKIAEESVRMYKRHIDSIKENRPLTVFEKMSRNLSRNIIKDEVVRESYITESGTLDTDLIVESSKVMYGFLETINTLQLDKVDNVYIKKVLDGMN